MQLPGDYDKAPIKIALLAGEPSGDRLGHGLIEALKKRWPQACFVGIGGNQMQASGLHSLYAMERLSVMGLFEPLKRAKELLSLRSRLKSLFKENPPDVFIGIDAPDFNLNLEKSLKEHGILTMHYVSPTIWAWRPGRIKAIKKAVSHMLLIFPFEKKIYDKHHVPSTFVGHSLADTYPLRSNQEQAKENIGLKSSEQILALLIGSRKGEIERLSEPFLKTAQIIQQARPNLKIVAAMHSQKLADLFEKQKQAYPDLDISIIVDKTKEVLLAADVAMVKSGTSTLEASLAKTPHIVAYKTSSVTYLIAKCLVKTPYISMTNIMAGKPLVQEFVQNQCKPQDMARALLALLEPSKHKAMIEEFTTMHQSLKCQTNEVAAGAIIQTIEGRVAGCQSSQV